ncbi:MAG TPA: ABC transporter substrate-binding protein [Candidatus Binatia bacterium]|nr:ABC transporter substrate-binding protein [Candidatus Binatia bacterium]
MKRIQQVTEVASRLVETDLADKPLYWDQAFGDGVDCQEKTFKSHGTEQSRTLGGDEALSSDFVTVQGQSRLCHGPNVSLPTRDHNPLRPSRFQLKTFRQRSGYHGKSSAGVYEQLNFFGTPRRSSQTTHYMKESHLRQPFETMLHCNSAQEQRNRRALAARKTRKKCIGSNFSGLTLIAMLFVLNFGAEAQQPKKAARIGYLTLGFAPTEPEVALKQRLSDLGWLEGQNLTIEYRRAANDTRRLPSLAKELVDSKVDVIVASATPAIKAAKDATVTIPIVMSAAADSVGMGFIVSLARPGGNITGLSLQSPELAGKRIELLKEIVPKLTRVAFLAHGGDPAHKLFLSEAQDIAPRIGIQIQLVVVESPAEFETAFSAMIRERVGALVVQPLLTGSALGQGRKVANLAAKHRLPAVCPIAFGFRKQGA